MNLLGEGERRSWVEPELAGLGRLPARASLYPFADIASALSRDRAASPWFRSLDGDWRFSLAPRPEAIPAGFEGLGFDDGAWGTIPVPSNW